MCLQTLASPDTQGVRASEDGCKQQVVVTANERSCWGHRKPNALLPCDTSVLVSCTVWLTDSPTGLQHQGKVSCEPGVAYQSDSSHAVAKLCCTHSRHNSQMGRASTPVQRCFL